MKKTMTNITVLVMIALPLYFVGWFLFPHVYGEQSPTQARGQQFASIQEIQAIHDYQQTCSELNYSCNDDLIHMAQSNTLQRKTDAQASDTLFDKVSRWINL